MDTVDNVQAQLEALGQAGTPEETVAMLQEISEEQPDGVSIVISLLAGGWTISRSGEAVICIALRSASSEHEVLGHGSNILDAFEDTQLKTKNFSKLLTGV